MNQQTATEAVFIQAAISANLSKDGGRHFKKLIESLQND